MATPVLPHEFAAPDVLKWWPDGVFIPGPQSVYGESFDRRTDGGGRWMAGLSEIPLLTSDSARMWQALMMRFNLSSTKLIVPCCAGHFRASFAGPATLVPHSDLTSFSDDTLYLSGSDNPTLTSGIELRATTAVLTMPDGAELIGAEAFTMTGPIFGPRLYGVVEVLDVTGDQVTILFGPPAREDLDAATEVDFQNPRCTMRPVLAQLPSAWPEWDTAWQSSVALTFQETFR